MNRSGSGSRHPKKGGRIMATTFMDPHDVPKIPGTEGWERMYPYQYQFSREDPERAAFESSQIWFYDGLHYPRASLSLRPHMGRSVVSGALSIQHPSLHHPARHGNRSPDRERLRLHQSRGRCRTRRTFRRGYLSSWSGPATISRIGTGFTRTGRRR